MMMWGGGLHGRPRTCSHCSNPGITATPLLQRAGGHEGTRHPSSTPTPLRTARMDRACGLVPALETHTIAQLVAREVQQRGGLHLVAMTLFKRLLHQPA